jgi:hypothetical protein
VPTLILATGKSVHIQDCIYALGRAGFDDAINKSESLFLHCESLLIVHEVTMIDWDADAVETQGSEELGIFPSEEVI